MKRGRKTKKKEPNPKRKKTSNEEATVDAILTIIERYRKVDPKSLREDLLESIKQKELDPNVPVSEFASRLVEVIYVSDEVDEEGKEKEERKEKLKQALTEKKNIEEKKRKVEEDLRKKQLNRKQAETEEEIEKIRVEEEEVKEIAKKVEEEERKATEIALQEAAKLITIEEGQEKEKGKEKEKEEPKAAKKPTRRSSGGGGSKYNPPTYYDELLAKFDKQVVALDQPNDEVEVSEENPTEDLEQWSLDQFEKALGSYSLRWRALRKKCVQLAFNFGKVLEILFDRAHDLGITWKDYVETKLPFSLSTADSYRLLYRYLGEYKRMYALPCLSDLTENAIGLSRHLKGHPAKAEEWKIVEELEF